ncbi:hypothetical protein LOD99_7808 [Oopsacas minuta]|uniref:Inositol 2-dehydrogenase n=1 Tax=Oopsacas minuta TaxID=111878 RepID=A0AAV7JPI6_9METZ|nr:hypothetical protein LOD99_7808 [Oopsacas minuta]
MAVQWQESNLPLGVAVIGIGRAGLIHFKGIRNNCKLKLLYLVDVDMDKVSQLIERNHLGGYVKPIHPSDMSTILEDPKLHMIVVTTPSFTHEQYIIAALHKNKAVFCEKPLAPDNQRVEQCYELSEKMKVPLYCAFQRRYDPGFRRIRDQVRQGAIGKVYVVKTCSRDSPVPSLEYLKSSGRIYHDCAVHDLDMVCYVLEDIPCSVYVKSHAWDPEIAAIKDDDTAVIVLGFKSGVIAIIDISRHSAYGYDQRLEVFGEKGMLKSENPREDEVETYSQKGVTLGKCHYSFPTRYEYAYQQELDEFIECILDPTREMLSGKKDTLLATRLAEACEESLRKKAEVPITL